MLYTIHYSKLYYRPSPRQIWGREMVRTKLQLLYLPHLAVLYPRHACVAAWLAHLIWEAEGDVHKR